MTDAAVTYFPLEATLAVPLLFGYDYHKRQFQSFKFQSSKSKAARPDRRRSASYLELET